MTVNKITVDKMTVYNDFRQNICKQIDCRQMTVDKMTRQNDCRQNDCRQMTVDKMTFYPFFSFFNFILSKLKFEKEGECIKNFKRKKMALKLLFKQLLF